MPTYLDVKKINQRALLLNDSVAKVVAELKLQAGWLASMSANNNNNNNTSNIEEITGTFDNRSQKIKESSEKFNLALNRKDAFNRKKITDFNAEVTPEVKKISQEVEWNLSKMISLQQALFKYLSSTINSFTSLYSKMENFPNLVDQLPVWGAYPGDVDKDAKVLNDYRKNIDGIKEIVDKLSGRFAEIESSNDSRFIRDEKLLEQLFSNYQTSLEQLSNDLVEVIQNLSGIARGARSIEKEILSKKDEIVARTAEQNERALLGKSNLFQPRKDEALANKEISMKRRGDITPEKLAEIRAKHMPGRK